MARTRLVSSIDLPSSTTARGHAFGLELLPRVPGRRLERRRANEEVPLPLAVEVDAAGEQMLARPDTRSQLDVVEPSLFDKLATCSVLVRSPGSSPPPTVAQTVRPSGTRNARADTVELVEQDDARGLANAQTGHETSSRSARNQRSRSSQGTAAFAGDVDGRTKRSASPSRGSWSPCCGLPPNGPRYASLPTNPRARGRSSSASSSSRSALPCEVALAKVGRAAGRSECGVRDPDAVAEQIELRGRLDHVRREPGREEQPPEVVARIGEVRRLRVRVEARVDPAEHDLEPRRENIGHGAGRRTKRAHDDRGI